MHKPKGFPDPFPRRDLLEERAERERRQLLDVLAKREKQRSRRRRMTGWQLKAVAEFVRIVADPKRLPRKRGDKAKIEKAIGAALDRREISYSDGDLRTLLASIYKDIAH